LYKTGKELKRCYTCSDSRCLSCAKTFRKKSIDECLICSPEYTLYKLGDSDSRCLMQKETEELAKSRQINASSILIYIIMGGIVLLIVGGIVVCYRCCKKASQAEQRQIIPIVYTGRMRDNRNISF
jgi:hypothetical protein